MKPSTITHLDKQFQESPVMLAGAVSNTKLNKFIESLDIALPADYLNFVSRYGAGTVGAFNIYGIGCSVTMSKTESSAIEVTKSFKKDSWSGLENTLVISSDHSGNPIFLKPSGEVWINDHDFGGIEKIADNFEDYLLNTCLS